MDPTDLNAAELSEAVHAGDLSCREVMAAHLDRIDARNPAVNAIVSLRPRDELMAEAAACDEELAAGFTRGWLHGMPIAVKDLALTKGLRTTSGSRLLTDLVPEADCLMVARMRAAGCLVIGKTNVPEFGLGSHTYNDVFGTTVNAYDPTRSAGGSSGGAAVALATRMVPVADGSDYMGSLRNPAGWNNVFGFRPSQGRVPAWPTLDAFVGQLSTEGPMGRSVLDMALLLGTQAGPDLRVPLAIDSRLAGLDTVADARLTLADDPAGVRVGWLADLGGHLAMEPGVLDTCQAALHRLEALGCTVEPVALPSTVSLDQVWDAWVTWRHQVVGNGLAPLVADPARRALMKPEAQWEVDGGAALSGARFAAAAQVRTAFHRAMVDLLRHVDVVALPTAQVWPFAADLHWPATVAGRNMDTYHRWMEVTIYATFAGLPAVAVPAGFGAAGLPMGLQLIGPQRADLDVLRLAAAYETTISDLRVGQA